MYLYSAVAQNKYRVFRTRNTIMVLSNTLHDQWSTRLSLSAWRVE